MNGDMGFSHSYANKKINLTPGGAGHLGVMFRVRSLKAKDKRCTASQH